MKKTLRLAEDDMLSRGKVSLTRKETGSLSNSNRTTIEQQSNNNRTTIEHGTKMVRRRFEESMAKARLLSMNQDLQLINFIVNSDWFLMR